MRQIIITIRIVYQKNGESTYARKYMSIYHTYCFSILSQTKIYQIEFPNLVTLSIFHYSFVIKRSFRSWIRRMKWQNYFWEINRERKTTIAKQINKQNATPYNNGRKFLLWFIYSRKHFSYTLGELKNKIPIILGNNKKYIYSQTYHILSALY